MPTNDPFDFDGAPIARAAPPARSVAAPTPAPIPMQWAPTCDGCGSVLDPAVDVNQSFCGKCRGVPRGVPLTVDALTPAARAQLRDASGVLQRKIARGLERRGVPVPVGLEWTITPSAAAKVRPDLAAIDNAKRLEETAPPPAAPTVYRDLAADRAGKYRGKPCQLCGQPIGLGSYSGTDGSHHCSKACSLADAGSLEPTPAPKTAPKAPRSTRAPRLPGVPSKITLAELWEFLNRSAQAWERVGDSAQAARVRAYRDTVFAGPEGGVTP